jgi:DedD protein
MPVENGMPENEDVRKKALLRLAVAGIVTTAALGGLWWLDQSGSSAPPTASSPAPIVAAPAPEVAAPQTEPQPEAQADAGAEPVDDMPPGVDAGAAAPPPPRVSNNMVVSGKNPGSTPPSLPTQAAVQPHSAPAVQPAASPTTSPAKTAPPPPAKPVAAPANGNNFVVQLGVFSNPENAREMVEKLRKQGIRAHLEARVQLGPFLNRAEAEKAQAEMRKLGYNALLTLPYSAVPAMK